MKGTRASRPRGGWQFTTAAVLAREVTARIFGPAVAWLVHGPSVSGVEHLVGLQAPVLICPTHASHLDFSVLRLALGRRYRRRLAPAVAADYFTASRQRWFFAAWLGAFPFERRRRGASASFHEAERLLGAGWSVLIFPEGTRSRDGTLGPFKPGAALLAIRTARQVLPVRIVGSHRVLPPGAVVPRRGRVLVRFGAPLVARPDEDARDLTQRLEAAIRAL
jgi:1-acyl-sn-glycerol-3-phosphate acyltransferase